MQEVVAEPLPHRAPHVPTAPARAWLPTLIYFINKDPPLPWKEVFLGSRQMILIRTKSSNIIFLLLCLGLGLNQGTGAHLEEKKPRWKLGQAAQPHIPDVPIGITGWLQQKGNFTAAEKVSGNGFTGDSLWKSRACPVVISLNVGNYLSPAPEHSRSGG